MNTKRTRQLHRLQNQIDTLEMRVARECKEGLVLFKDLFAHGSL